MVVARRIICYDDTRMTAIYEQSGLRFMYPENWVLDNRDDMGRPWSVSVHSPTGAFWSLTVLDGPDDLKQLASQTLQAIQEEYQESSFESITADDEVAGHTMTGHDINFFYLDFLVSAKLRAFRIGHHNCTVLCQAEDRDFGNLQQIFEAITYSLIVPQGSPASDGL